MSENAERSPIAPGPTAPTAPLERAPGPGARRQRRPTGAPPPLPHPIAISTTAWVLLAAVIVACAFLFSEITPWRRAGDQANTWVLLRLADVRTPWLTDEKRLSRARATTADRLRASLDRLAALAEGGS